jgi:translation initiation factor 6 (eIF-6)
MRHQNTVVDEKLGLLITAGAAIAANGPEVFEEAARKLITLNVRREELQGATVIGQMVKEKPAAHMKEVADVLTDTDFAQDNKHDCPASQMDTTSEAFRQIMLISAGAAMAANCEPCLNQVVPNLIEANVTSHDITKAVTIGQAVKDRISGQTQKLAHETLCFSA